MPTPRLLHLLRMGLLLLLALLLPVRGVAAAAMLCPGASHTHAIAHADAHGDAHADSAHQHRVHDHDHAGSTSTDGDKAKFCAASCSATPLASHAPELPLPALTSALSFPEFAAPAASFISGGPERPPRSS